MKITDETTILEIRRWTDLYGSIELAFTDDGRVHASHPVPLGALKQDEHETPVAGQ